VAGSLHIDNKVGRRPGSINQLGRLTLTSTRPKPSERPDSHECQTQTAVSQAAVFQRRGMSSKIGALLRAGVDQIGEN